MLNEGEKWRLISVKCQESRRESSFVCCAVCFALRCFAFYVMQYLINGHCILKLKIKSHAALLCGACTKIPLNLSWAAPPVQEVA